MTELNDNELDHFEDMEKLIDKFLSGEYKTTIKNKKFINLLKKIKEKKLTEISEEETEFLNNFADFYFEISTNIMEIMHFL